MLRWRTVAALVAAAVIGLAGAPMVLNAAEGDVLDTFQGSTLGSEWTFRDGYANQFPADTANHASVSVLDGHLSIEVPGGAEHNMWWLRHAEVQRAYEGSGVYEIRVNSDFTGYQQVGLSFESSPGNFMIFMLYSHDTVHGYVERFANVGGQQYKSTVVGASTGAFVPATGPWYIRVTVDDDANPAARTWHFQWSRDGSNWSTITSGALEGSDPTQNAGAIQKVGVFAGNQPEVFSAFDARIDYFSASASPLPPPPTPPVVLGSSLNGGAQLSWNAVPGAGSYRVYRSLGVGGAPALVASPTLTQFTDSGLTNGQSYVYTVTSVVAATESDPSVPVVVVPNAPPPVPLTGLVLGLDASTLGLADGSPVTSWAGYGSSAAGSGTSRPILVTNGIGGKPTVRFDGVNDYLGLGSGFEDFTSGVTLFVVSRPDALQPGFKILALGNGAGQANVGLGRAGTTNGMQYWTTASSGAYGWFDTTSVLSPGTAQLVTVRQPGGAVNSSVAATLSVNGASIGGGTVFVPPVTTRSVNYLGRSYWNEGWFSGDLSEVLVYNRALTTTEVAAVTGYLTSKYGLAGPPAPGAPSGLSATAGNASVTLTWGSVSGATGYRVYRATGGGAASAVADVATTGYTDTSVVNGTAYTYTVRALGAGGESGPSNAVSATPVAPPSPPPVPLTGLVLGLDASTLGLADGSPVTSWAGYGTSAAGSGTSRPTLVTNGIGGKPTVRFDGVNDYLGLGSGFEDFTSGVTLFVVSRPDALQPGFKILALGNGAGQANVGLGRAGTTNGMQYWTTASSGAYGWFDTTSVLSPGTAQLVTVRQPGGAVNSSVAATLSVNGASIGGGTVFVPPVTTRSVNYLGRSYWNEGWFSGDLSEVLVYNRALTTTEITAVTGYLTSKYWLGQ